ncbi:MAG: alpha/beta hydrolase, partial [Nitrospirae bacterium]|nr:alpha/beta hydrolase [Nitrospirota bacterium]
MSVLNRVKEKRLSTRLLLSVPVVVEPPSDPGRPRPLPQSCTSIDVSDRGIGLACSSPIDLTDCVLVLKIPGNDGITLPGRLCWSARDPKTNSCRYGFAFAGEDGPAQTRLRRHLADLLLDRTRIGGRKVPTTIQSDLISFTNRRGKRIVAFYDHPVGEIYKPDTPFVVMPPAYGEHKTTALLPAYTFAANGFHVLRYDTTDSVGESDGAILDFTLSQHEEDLHAALDYVENSFQAYPIVVCAASLGARSALKAASCDPRIRALALLVPVVDLQATLTAVHLEDLVDRHLRGHDYGTMNVLGHSVKADHFLGNSIAFNFHNLQTTLEDSRSTQVPVHVIAGLRDTWVSLDAVKLALESISSECKTLYLL